MSDCPISPRSFEYWIYQITKVADRETDRKRTLRTFHCYPHLPRSTKVHALDIIEHFFLHPDHPMPMEGHLKKSLPRHAWERWVHATKHEVPPTNKQNTQTKTPCRYFRDVIGREWVGGKEDDLLCQFLLTHMATWLGRNIFWRVKYNQSHPPPPLGCQCCVVHFKVSRKWERKSCPCIQNKHGLAMTSFHCPRFESQIDKNMGGHCNRGTKTKRHFP